MNTAKISEIFFSYQGEGLYVGMPQIFLRFSGCNLKCDYCDTNHEKNKTLSVDEVLDKIVALSRKHFLPIFSEFKPCVSVTGGEPLLHSGFLLKLLPILKKRGFIIHLETNGTKPKELKKVINFVDVVSMDVKLPSDCDKSFFKEHDSFLKISKNKAYVKIVLTSKTNEEELKKAALLVKKNTPKAPLFLQPATPVGKSLTISPQKLHKYREISSKIVKNVFILPQLHKLWKIR